MKIYRVSVDTAGSRYSERSEHLVTAGNSEQAIKKACREAERDGCYQRYDATNLELVGDAI